MTRPLPYPPPWQDISTLCSHICVSPSCVDIWVKQGLLPPPRLRGGKRLWRWSEVEKYLEGANDTMPCSVDEQAESIRNATRRAASSS